MINLVSRYSLIKIVLLSIVFSSFLNALTGEELQKRGIEGIEKFIQHFQETGQLNKQIAQKSFDDLNQSINLFRKDGNLKEVAFTTIKIGNLVRMSNKFDLAYQYYISALASALKIGDKETEARALLGKSRVEILYLHKYGDASKNINKALSLINKLDIKELNVELLDFKAEIEIKKGDYISASIILDEAFELAKDINDDVRLYSLYNIHADLNYNLAKICDYDNFFDECTEKLKIAESSYRKSLKIAKKSKWTFFINLLENGSLSNTKEELKLVEQREKSKKKWDKFSSVFNPKSEKNVLVHEHFILTPLKDSFPSSMVILLKGIVLAGKLAGVTTVNQSYLEAFEKEVEGNIEKALKMYMNTVNLLESQRANLDVLKTDSFLNDKMDVYYKPILHLLNLKRKKEAFNLFERSHEKTLLDLIDFTKLKTNQELVTFRNLMELNTRISSLKKKKKVKELSILEKEYEHILSSSTKRANNRLMQIPSLEEVQKNLEQEDYEIIEYLVDKTQLIVWHITKDTIDVKSVYLPQHELSKKVKSIYETLKTQNAREVFDITSAKELFLFLIQPILKNIKSKHLVIVPHYQLNQLPFQVLINPETNQSLGETFQISYAPSTTILMGLKHIQNLKDKKILAIRDESMTYGIKEIKSIEKLYPKQMTIFDSLRKNELFKEVKGKNVIHISTHGKYLPHSPMLSYLKLKDKKLRASEMFAMPLEENSLVVLSACETGKVQFTQSNETLGMVRALLYAGADTLLLSSWKVDEKVTVLWMETFYKYAKTESIVESVRQAIIEVKKIYPHPHYWAGFSMIGK